MPLIVDQSVFTALASGVLLLHALFVLWVVFGAFFTEGRPVLRWFHIGSLLWGIFTELSPWQCPLTILEDWLEGQAGVRPYEGGFLLHYLDAIVYPNISATVLTAAGVAICALNLAVYARQFWKSRRLHTQCSH
jgi:Protein of Unknown function (DUF2784)